MTTQRSQTLSQFFNGIEIVLEKVIGVLCLVLIVCLFMEVVNRYVFGTSMRAIYYIIPFCFLWMCMLGSALAVRRHLHFEVDLLANFFKGKTRAIHSVLMLLSVLLGGAIIAWSSIDFAELGLSEKSPVTGASMIYIYASLLIGGLLISLMALEKLFIQFGLIPSDTQDNHNDREHNDREHND